MRTRQEIVKDWNEPLSEKNKENGTLKNYEAYLFEVLLDIRDLMSEKVEEQKAQLGTCVNCGLLKKLWDESFCLEGREHTE